VKELGKVWVVSSQSTFQVRSVGGCQSANGPDRAIAERRNLGVEADDQFRRREAAGANTKIKGDRPKLSLNYAAQFTNGS